MTQLRAGRTRAVVVALCATCALFAPALLGGCSKPAAPASSAPKSASTAPSSTPAAPATPQEALSSFWSATKKHGTLIFTSSSAGNAALEKQKVEYWVDGEKYRLIWYRPDGSVRLYMVSPDGKQLLYVDPKTKEVRPGIAKPEFHLMILNGPAGWQPTGGSGSGNTTTTTYTYPAKKWWNVQGAGQEFYLEDLVFTATPERIVSVVARTAGSREKVAAGDLTTSKYEFAVPELGVEAPAGTFEAKP